MLEKNITEENIKIFVRKFYTTIMEDDEVGPFFINILGDDINNEKWQTHIEVLNNFWASVTLGHRSYKVHHLLLI